MRLIAHDQRGDATSHRYSIQIDSGEVWLLFDIPKGSPFKPNDVAFALDLVLPKLEPITD